MSSFTIEPGTLVRACKAQIENLTRGNDYTKELMLRQQGARRGFRVAHTLLFQPDELLQKVRLILGPAEYAEMINSDVQLSFEDYNLVFSKVGWVEHLKMLEEVFNKP